MEAHYGQEQSSPSAVSQAFIQIMNDTKKMESDVSKIFPEKKKRNTSASMMPRAGNQKSVQYQGMFDKLFGEKVVYFSDTERSYASILTNIYKLVFKVIPSLFR